jgi:hypothetical protein
MFTQLGAEKQWVNGQIEMERQMLYTQTEVIARTRASRTAESPTGSCLPTKKTCASGFCFVGRNGCSRTGGGILWMHGTTSAGLKDTASAGVLVAGNSKGAEHLHNIQYIKPTM